MKHHIASGQAKRHPERMLKRENEPTDIPGLGKPPKHIRGNILKAWNRIINTCAAGVLKQSDEISVELAARLLNKVSGRGRSAITISERQQLMTLLNKFGMNPSDRSQVSVITKTRDNEFASVTRPTEVK